MNSFQQWVMREAPGFGFTVTLCGNWVRLHYGHCQVEVMSERGVQAIFAYRNALGDLNFKPAIFASALAEMGFSADPVAFLTCYMRNARFCGESV